MLDFTEVSFFSLRRMDLLKDIDSIKFHRIILMMARVVNVTDVGSVSLNELIDESFSESSIGVDDKGSL
jgi:hypothetical protein